MCNVFIGQYVSTVAVNQGPLSLAVRRKVALRVILGLYRGYIGVIWG